MDHSNDRLPPELRALFADLKDPPARDTGMDRVARGERAFDAIAARLGDSDPLLADIAEILWAEYSELGQQEHSDAQLQRIVTVLDRPDAAPSRTLGMGFRRLAERRLQEKRWSDAIALGKRGIAAYVSAGVSDDLEASELRYILGTAYVRQGEFATAQEVLLSSLPALRQHAGGRVQLVKTLNLLSQNSQMENLGESFLYLLEGMQLFGLQGEALDHFFEKGLNVCKFHLDAMQYEQAEPCLLAMLEVLDNTSPTDPSLLPRILDLLGEIQLEFDQYSEALESYERALRAGETAYGPDSAEMAKLYIRMADVHDALEDSDAAQQALRRAITIYDDRATDAAKDTRYLEALWDHSKRCLTAERFDDAYELAHRLHGLVQSIENPIVPRMGELLGLLGRIQFARGHYEDALSLLDQGVERLRESGASAEACMRLAELAVDIRLYHRPPDEQLLPARKRLLAIRGDVIRELEGLHKEVARRFGRLPDDEQS